MVLPVKTNRRSLREEGGASPCCLGALLGMRPVAWGSVSQLLGSRAAVAGVPVLPGDDVHTDSSGDGLQLPLVGWFLLSTRTAREFLRKNERVRTPRCPHSRPPELAVGL